MRFFVFFRCGKFMAPLIREQMAFFEPWPPFCITADIKAKLLIISPAAIGRVLKDDRKKPALTGKSGTKPGKLLKKRVTVRTCYPWNERKRQTRLLGFFEIDTDGWQSATTAEHGTQGNFA